MRTRSREERTRLIGNAALTLVSAAVIVLMLAPDPGPMPALRRATFDTYQALFPRQRVSAPAIIVEIDDKSLQRIGQWPWPRDVMANLIDRIVLGGPRAIAIDIFFPEPDRASPERIADRLRSRDPDLADRLGAMQANDDILAEAVARAPSVLGVIGLHYTRNALPSDAPASAAAVPFRNYPDSIRSIPLIDRAAKGHGLVNAEREGGVVRRMPLVGVATGEQLLSLGLESLRVAAGAPAYDLFEHGDSLEIGLSDLRIVAQQDGMAWLHFSPSLAARYVAAADVLASRVPPAAFKGAIVLVGVSATGLGDVQTTAGGQRMPGVEVHAQLIENVVDGALLFRPRWGPWVETLAFALGAALILLVGPRLAPRHSVIALLTGCLVIALAGAVAFLWARVLIDIALPMAAFVCLFGIYTTYGFFVEARAKRRIIEFFRQYVPRELVDALARNPDTISLEGESRHMTVLFTDVRDFTRISEGFEPRALSQFMNAFLTPLTEVVYKHGGTVDKFMGDSIMAFWGAPLDDPQHARNAVFAALEMNEVLRELGPQFRSHGWPEIQIGVGLNTGRMSVGNMGSKRRTAYTVMGDAVNLASRLEGLTREYGLPVIVGEATKNAAPEIAFREIDRVRVRGKDVVMTIYEPLGLRSRLSRSTLQESALFALALGCYRGADWDGAERHLHELSRIAPKRLYALFLERIASLRANAPSASWDAAQTFTAKEPAGAWRNRSDA